MNGISVLRNVSNEELVKVIQASSSKLDIMRSFDISPKNKGCVDYVSKFIESNNLDISHHRMGNPAFKRYNKEQLQEWSNMSYSWTALMKLMDLRFVGSNIKTAKRIVEYYSIDVSHFDYKKAIRQHKSSYKSSNIKTHDEIFCENSTVSRATVKRKIISENLLPLICAECELTDVWNDKPLVLHLEHLNGINNDNQLTNLCFLCPNCHSQTATYAGRNVSNTTRSVNGEFNVSPPI